MSAENAESLRQQIKEHENKLFELRNRLAEIESNQPSYLHEEPLEHIKSATRWPLTPEEYTRYGRQMIVPGIGIKGQLRITASSVLIIGAGGLGCPAAAYLAGAGVKKLGLVDGDTVEISNLHRQILHSSDNVGLPKVDSAIRSLRQLNQNVEYSPYYSHLTPENAESIVSEYDIVLDCTDRPSSRYLISDICVLLGKPLISASALRTDGQLMALNTPARAPGDSDGGPCYRCIFPKPPPADQVISCGDGGILGPVVGVMGVLQALEAIKTIISDSATGSRPETSAKTQPTLLLFSTNSPSPFRSVRLRPRRPDCIACSPKAEIKLNALSAGSVDYIAFCGLRSSSDILSPTERISAKSLSSLRGEVNTDHVLIDVREKVQFDVCSLSSSINVPFSAIGKSHRPEQQEQYDWLPSDPTVPIYVICRLGNDSQIVTRKLREESPGRQVYDIKDGFKAWRADVDPHWPDY